MAKREWPLYTEILLCVSLTLCFVCYHGKDGCDMRDHILSFFLHVKILKSMMGKSWGKSLSFFESLEAFGFLQ